jgi:hypothetical protein
LIPNSNYCPKPVFISNNGDLKLDPGVPNAIPRSNPEIHNFEKDISSLIVTMHLLCFPKYPGAEEKVF